mgnify:CR=1 FL=1
MLSVALSAAGVPLVCKGWSAAQVASGAAAHATFNIDQSRPLKSFERHLKFILGRTRGRTFDARKLGQTKWSDQGPYDYEKERFPG